MKQHPDILSFVAPRAVVCFFLGLASLGGCIGSMGPTLTGGEGAGGSGGGSVLADGGPQNAASGIPCDVAQILGNNCWSCHGDPPIAGVPVSLASYDVLRGPSPQFPSETVGQRAVARMQSAPTPMPPAPASTVSAADIATVQAWVQGGYQPGSCGSTDAGAGDYGTPPVCTSGKMWTGGDRGSANMQPGQACIACHSQGEGPRFAIAGTVYPTAREPADCNGTPGTGVTVVIQPAQGAAAITLTPNSVGNFSYAGTIALPYTAKVVSGGRERAMATPQTSGDCNSCHAQNGANSAPGRIMLP